jgi:hypothetical protein
MIINRDVSKVLDHLSRDVICEGVGEWVDCNGNGPLSLLRNSPSTFIEKKKFFTLPYNYFELRYTDLGSHSYTLKWNCATTADFPT